MWKHNNFFIGALFAVLLILAGSLMVFFLAPWFYGQFSAFLPQNKVYLLTLIAPVLLMRYYMKPLGYNKSAMGVVTVIFALMIVYFVFFASGQHVLFVR